MLTYFVRYAKIFVNFLNYSVDASYYTPISLQQIILLFNLKNFFYEKLRRRKKDDAAMRVINWDGTLVSSAAMIHQAI